MVKFIKAESGSHQGRGKTDGQLLLMGAEF